VRAGGLLQEIGTLVNAWKQGERVGSGQYA